MRGGPGPSEARLAEQGSEHGYQTTLWTEHAVR